MSLIWHCNLSEIFTDSCGVGIVEVKSRWNIERTTAVFSIKWSFQFRALTLHKFYLSQKNSFWFILLALVSISGINLEQICSLSHSFLVLFQGCNVWVKIEMLFWEHIQTLLWRVCHRDKCAFNGLLPACEWCCLDFFSELKDLPKKTPYVLNFILQPPAK